MEAAGDAHTCACGSPSLRGPLRVVLCSGQPDANGYVKINALKSDGTCCQTVHQDTLGCQIPPNPQYYPPAPTLQNITGPSGR